MSKTKESELKKYNLDEIQCSVKNGLLTIFVPYEKGSKPKEAKIS